MINVRFQITAAVLVGCLGLYALFLKETTLAATALGILGGILNAPKQPPPPATLSDLINYTTAQAVLNPKGETK